MGRNSKLVTTIPSRIINMTLMVGKSKRAINLSTIWVMLITILSKISYILQILIQKT